MLLDSAPIVCANMIEEYYHFTPITGESYDELYANCQVKGAK
ncbi:hypothetical protein FHS18_006575 [Paenibacillus phyllosphaerae]|uniref:Uncharacterized protein n=1 Tax=Paenibacillus phyllosphaerae TaxID=274593 RepID=A0A7W5B4W1_9BACL|nr:hypothetical protein [Paenibacillus phyllosphaerae]